MLRAALQNAIDNGIVSDFYANGEGYSGIPMKMDRDFVAIACFKANASPPVSACWILRIDRIDAICTAGQSWSDDRGVGLKSDDDEDEPPSPVLVEPQ